MIKNSRPYTNENGILDDGLLTQKSLDEISEVMKWIKENIKPSKKKLWGESSYSLKHKLNHDTKIYLTNNEFKDAMMFAGYMPLDVNKLNWEYKIVLTKSINDNPSPFFKWVLKEYLKRDTANGDFAEDMKRDFNFPMVADYGVIKRYLHRVGACEGALKAFDKLWSEYKMQKIKK